MKRKLLLLPLISLCLCSCTSNIFVLFDEFPEVTDSYEKIDGDNYYKPSEYFGDNSSYQEIYRSFPHENDRQVNLPYVGDSRLLVIPIAFKDYTCRKTLLGCSSTLTQIKNAFFGKETQTKGESVTSYYAKSSYGKLRLSGEVTDWFQSEFTIKDIKNDDSYSNLSSLLLSAVGWAKSRVDISSYDTDKDGFIDGVCFIYSAPYENNTHLWAYKSILNVKANLKSPNVKNFMWASCEYMNLRNIFSKPDARTYIHEVGHLLGLPDYYPLNSSQKWFPLGKSDMMDLNIGDHNVFSKMLLNWTRPYVVNGDCEITLNPTYMNGDCILVKNNWSGSAMEEYLLLEFYLPEGLHSQDSKLSFIYDNTETIRPIDDFGIKIYHIDARVGFYKTYSPSPFIGYDSPETRDEVDKLNKGGQLTYQKIANTNTEELSPNGNYLITLLEPDGSTFERVVATNNSLFKNGQGINDFLFNDGNSLGYNIVVKNLNSNSATISFSKIA